MIVSGMRKGAGDYRLLGELVLRAGPRSGLDVRATGWHVRVDGDAPLDIDIRFAVPIERMGAVSPGYTAHRAVNAVPYVCAARPGIRPSTELPQIIPALT